jgi:DNA polymerase III subunit epsilon
MREIVLDTETTGLDPADGHRIVEIGAVELVNHIPTGRVFHQYVNPERPMPREALAVHGLDDVFLRDKPVFASVAEALLAFLAEAPLVIHNAGFDIAFLNAEFGRLGRPVLSLARAVNTVEIAKRRFPGAQISLDALCKRFGIDCTARTLHGALLDSQLLAEVYLELLGGRQQGLGLAVATGGSAVSASAWTVPPRPRALAPRLTDSERAAHAAFIAEFGDTALWHPRSDESAPGTRPAAAAM